MSSVCESSPWKSGQHQLHASIQFRVMRELELDVWDPNNQEATALFDLLLAQKKNPTNAGTPQLLIDLAANNIPLATSEESIGFPEDTNMI